MQDKYLLKILKNCVRKILIKETGNFKKTEEQAQRIRLWRVLACLSFGYTSTSWWIGLSRAILL